MNTGKLEQELVAAQVAIGKIKTWLDEQANKVRGKFLPLSQTEKLDERLAVFIETSTFIRQLDVDLSALHQHDAEVREPLVKALEQIQSKSKSRITCSRPDICSDCTHLEQIRSIASNALAKVKEGK